MISYVFRVRPGVFQFQGCVGSKIIFLCQAIDYSNYGESLQKSPPLRKGAIQGIPGQGFRTGGRYCEEGANTPFRLLKKGQVLFFVFCKEGRDFFTFFKRGARFQKKSLDQVLQPALAISWTLHHVRDMDNVRDMASFHCPYSGHQNLMSGIWTVKTGHIPDIKNRCPGYGQ